MNKGWLWYAAATTLVIAVIAPGPINKILISTPVAALQHASFLATAFRANTMPPTIMLNGPSTMAISIGNRFVDLGANAHDAAGSDLSKTIVETGSVDTTTAGVYTLTYTVVDKKGSTTTTSRSVTVITPASITF